MGNAAVTPLLGHLDVALSQFAIGYRNTAFVADILAPRVGVARQTDKYIIADREGQRAGEKTLRASGAPARRIRMTESMDSYFADSHALSFELVAETENIGRRRQQLAQMLMDKILLDKEIACAALLTSTAKVTTNRTLAGADQWSAATTSDPQGDVETAKSAIRLSGVEANIIVITDPVFQALKKHPAVKKAFAYTAVGSIGVAQLQSFFAIDRVVVANGVQVDGAGAASFIWGKDCLAARVEAAPGMEDLSLAKTFVWENGPGTVAGIGYIYGQNPDPTAKSEIQGLDFYYEQKVTCVAGGYLIKAAVA